MNELLPIQSALLARLAKHAPIANLLDYVATALEELLPEVLVSVLMVDGSGRVRHAAGPSLSPSYIAAIDGASIGPKAGSCGTAAFRKQAVIVADIATDPLWEDYRELALAHDLRACWSLPILSQENEALGTFAVYRRVVGLPSHAERELIDGCAGLVQLLLNYDRRDEELNILRQGMQMTPLPLMLADAELRIRYANPALVELFGYPLTELVGRPVDMLRSARTANEVYEELRAVVKAGHGWKGEISERHRDGSDIPIELSVTPVPMAAQGLLQYFVVMMDLRERQAAAAELEQLAFHDAVTGLPNRSLLQDRLGMSLAHARREGHFCALLFFDLDHFKLINDLHGHSQGDAVLAAVAARLSEVLREDDSVARLGGDEFVVLSGTLANDQLSAAQHALHLGDKLARTLSKPMQVRGHVHTVTASVGITVFPKSLESGEDLLREADTAMYQAKNSGRDAIVLFDPEMQRALHERDSLERDLREALVAGQLDVYLQPQVDHTGQPCAAEALLRWNHPRRGMVPPSCFIPVAEECGLIVPIGDWVLLRVCGWLARCAAAGKPAHIAVNVSARQFREQDFQARVQAHLARTGADPVHLTLELTESLLIEDAETSAQVMHALAKLGLRFSIDDFGTGYSNLAYLKRLPLRELKIDKTFVQDICEDSSDAALVQTILTMAGHLGLTVVAEGVETEAQSKLLREWGCQRQQGYFYGVPLTGDQVIQAWLADDAVSGKEPAT